jgi:hypothetical protein
MTKKARQVFHVADLDFSQPVRLRGNRVGTLVNWSDTDGPIVDHHSNPHGPIVARTTVSLDAETVQRAIENRQEVLLVFESERSDRPIIVGLLTEQPQLESHPSELRNPLHPHRMFAQVDGRHVRIEAKDEIVLQCGKGSIVLKRDGKIVVRGTEIVTRASGTNKIKGASVKIN